MGRQASRQSCLSVWKVSLSSSWPEAALGGGTGWAAGALCAAWSLLGEVLMLPGFLDSSSSPALQQSDAVLLPHPG